MTPLLAATEGNLAGLVFEVRILAERSMFGRSEVLVTPVAGAGQRWVVASRIVSNEEEGAK